MKYLDPVQICNHLQWPLNNAKNLHQFNYAHSLCEVIIDGQENKISAHSNNYDAINI